MNDTDIFLVITGAAFGVFYNKDNPVMGAAVGGLSTYILNRAFAQLESAPLSGYPHPAPPLLSYPIRYRRR